MMMMMMTSFSRFWNEKTTTTLELNWR